MNVEENRLQTFHTWPGNPPVEPIQLAREGFYATGNFLEAECNWCHKRTNDWQYGDNVAIRHFQLDPLCVFITNPSVTGNIPLIVSDESSINSSSGATTVATTMTTATTHQQQPEQISAVPTTSSSSVAQQGTPVNISQLDLKIEANRLATFVNWPNPNITPQSLAKAGFYYLNRSDQVKCAWCKGVIAKWEKQDNAFEEHQRFFPDCPRVQLGPLIEIASDGIRDLGIQQISPPKRPKFSSLDARLRTYTNWPISEIQKPEALAQAGLYYHDVDDQVRCFHCYIGLRSWQKEDDPWFEHAKWYPQCQFVRLVKGPNYVQQVQQMTRHSAHINSIGDLLTTMSEPSNPQNLTATMSIDDAMCSSPVLQALEIGIDVGSIRTVTQRRLQQTGRPYDTVENLLMAVFGDPDVNDQDDYLENSNQFDDVENVAISNMLRDLLRSSNQANETQEQEPDSNLERDTTAGTTLVSNVVATQPNCVSPTNFNTDTMYSGTDVAPTITAVASPHHVVSTTTTLNAKATDGGENKAVESSVKNTCVSPQANSNSNERNISLEEENRKLKDARLCKVCLDDEVGVVFLPCGHLVTCVQCAPGVNQCPMCRTAIKGFVRTFLS